MTSLVTGATGFVGGHLAPLLAERGDSVVGAARRDVPIPAGYGALVAIDLLDQVGMRDLVRRVRPDRVFHLAGISDVAASWREPEATFEANLLGTLSVLEAVRLEAPEAAVVLAGSGQQYAAPEDGRPIAEDAAARPQSPYAASKAASDLLGGLYADAHGLAVLRMRSFNHAGPGQRSDFVIASFACQIARAEWQGRRSVVVETGRLDVRRDFTDVRDVARAYSQAAGLGRAEAFNVCSGRAVSVADILRALAGLTELEVIQRPDPARLRGHEVMEIRGSHDKLTEATGWRPEIALERTLADALTWWRERFAAGGGR